MPQISKTTATIIFPDKSSYTYHDAPADITSDEVMSQAVKDFNKKPVSVVLGGQPAAAPRAPVVNQRFSINPFVDVAKSIPTGLAQGAATVVGMPGDVRDLATQGYDWLSSTTKEQRAEYNKNPAMKALSYLPTSEDINQAADKTIGYYKPQTTYGEYAQKIAQFAPVALTGGEGLVARGLNVAVPAIASQFAADEAKGTKYEPYAEAAGALAGAGGLGLARAGAKTIANLATPSKAKLDAMKSAAYTAAKNEGVLILPESYDKFADDFANKMNNTEIVHPEVHKGTQSAIEILQDEKNSKQLMTLERADVVRQALNGAVKVAASNNDADLRLAMKVKNGFDKYLDGLTEKDVLSGDPKTAIPILKSARELARRSYKSDDIQELIDLAKNAATSQFSGAGEEQALRVQFKNFNARLIKDNQLAASFSPAERDAIKNVAAGGDFGNALRFLGKFAPTGNISTGMGGMVGAGIGGYLAGPTGAVIGAGAVPAIGGLARAGATAITNRNARLAEALMRAGSTGTNFGSQSRKGLALGTALSQSNNRPNYEDFK
jgi:hypothetical protein